MKRWSAERVGMLCVVGLGIALGPARADAASGAPASAAETLAVARIGIASAMLAQKRGEILLVDVRGAGQRALGHIAHDVGLPIDQWASRQKDLPRQRRLVFYCSCPAEEVAIEAARRMLAAGDSRVAVLVGGFDAWRAAGGPIAVDATWEMEFNVSRPPVGWGKAPEDSMHCRYARDREVAYGGGSSGRIECVLDTTARGFAGFVQRLDAAPWRGREIRFSAMVRSELVAPFGFLWVGAEDADGKLISMDRAEPPIRGTQDWHLATVRGTVPEGAVRVLIGLNLAGQGGLWIDEAELVATEAKGQPERRVPITNAGFEE